MINATLGLILNSCGGERGSGWLAKCEWNGRTFEARSRSGAIHALCRELVVAGVPDMPMQVLGDSGKHQLTYGSIHTAARRTIIEGNDTPIRGTTYAPPPPSGSTVLGFAKIRGSRGVPATYLAEAA